MSSRQPADQSRIMPPATPPRAFAEVVAGLEVAAIDAVEEARRARGDRAATTVLAGRGDWLRRVMRRLGLG